MNPHIKDIRRNVWHYLLWHLGHYDEAKVENPPSNFVYPGQVKEFKKEEPYALWIGHSTYLMEVNGIRILTDPIWEDYCAPVPIRGLKRQTAVPFALSDLARIDLVLISHNHYDHLGEKTVLALHRMYPQIEWVVPDRLSPWFHKRGIDRVTELTWWKNCIAKKCRITAVPAQHYSGRTPWDMNATHWNGYVVEVGAKRIYFTGDTGYNPEDFKAIGRYFKAMDLSLIPIGTYIPKEFMKTVHIGPQEAVQIHEEVGSRLSLGMHWRTFGLSDEPLDRPPYDLYLEMKRKNLPFETFLPIDVGLRVNF